MGEIRPPSQDHVLGLVHLERRLCKELNLRLPGVSLSRSQLSLDAKLGGRG